MASRSAGATRPRPLAAAVSTRPTLAAQGKPRRRPSRPSGSETSTVVHLAAERRHERVERALAAVGDRARGRPAGPPASRPRPIAAATSVAVNVPLNESGATSTDWGMPRTRLIGGRRAQDCICSRRHSAGGLSSRQRRILVPWRMRPPRGVIERDLDHQLRAQRDPLQILLALPAAGIAVAALAGLIRRQPLHQRPLLGGAQAGGVADDVQLARLVVEAEDQRADRALLLAGPVPGHDRVDGAHALDLDHALSLPGAVRGARDPWPPLPRRRAATRPSPPDPGSAASGRWRRRPAIRAPSGGGGAVREEKLVVASEQVERDVACRRLARPASRSATPPGGSAAGARRSPRGRRRRR